MSLVVRHVIIFGYGHGLTASNHRRISQSPHTRTFNHGAALVVRHVTIFGHGHGLQRAIIDESQHRTPERLIMAAALGVLLP